MSKKQPTTLVGGYIKTTLLDAAFIKTNIINADDAVIKNIKTAGSGKRVEITESLNNIRIYDDYDNVLIEIDDDSAFEGRIFYPEAVPPFTETLWGPGIRVGTPSGKSASLGRKGLVLTDSSGVIRHNISETAGGAALVKFDVNGGFFLDNVPNSADAYGSPLKNIRVYYDTDAGGMKVLTWKEV